MSEKEKIEVRMTINGILAKRLNTIKEYLQLESYTDVIRLLITEKYERTQQLQKKKVEKEKEV